MNPRDVGKIIDDLFNRAKEKDEFEYACALLRIRGAEDAGWDPLYETDALFSDLSRLVQAPIETLARVRLLLLIYCHITEVDAIYIVLYNMIAIIQGDRCNSYPFISLYSGNTMNGRPPSAKTVVEYLKKHAKENNENKVTEILEWMFNDAIRNAFFHSDYILFNNEFRSRDGKFEIKPKHLSSVMQFEQLEDIINRGTTFYMEFIKTFQNHKKSYKNNKNIFGRFAADGSIIPIELTADRKRGLYGFKG